MSGVGKDIPRFTQIYEEFKPKVSGDNDKGLRGTDNGKIFLRQKFGDGDGPSERAQGARNIYGSIARDYGEDIARSIFPGGLNELKRGDLPVIKQNIEHLLQQRFDQRGGQGDLIGTTKKLNLEQRIVDNYVPFEKDLDSLKKHGGSVSQEMTSRLMKQVEARSENRAWGSLGLGLGMGRDLQHVAQLMPPEVRLNITNRMGPQTTAREMLQNVLITIDGAKSHQGNDENLGKDLNEFIQWTRENEDHGLPKELVEAIVDFRETWVQHAHSPREQMDRLGLPEEVKKPLEEAFRLRDELIQSRPGERPSHPGDRQPPMPSYPEVDPNFDDKKLNDYYRDLDDHNTYPERLQSYPQRLNEWQEKQKLHNQIEGRFNIQLQSLHEDTPGWLLEQLKS